MLGLNVMNDEAHFFGSLETPATLVLFVRLIWSGVHPLQGCNGDYHHNGNLNFKQYFSEKVWNYSSHIVPLLSPNIAAHAIINAKIGIAQIKAATANTTRMDRSMII